MGKQLRRTPVWEGRGTKGQAGTGGEAILYRTWTSAVCVTVPDAAVTLAAMTRRRSPSSARHSLATASLRWRHATLTTSTLSPAPDTLTCRASTGGEEGQWREDGAGEDKDGFRFILLVGDTAAWPARSSSSSAAPADGIGVPTSRWCAPAPASRRASSASSWRSSCCSCRMYSMASLRMDALSILVMWGTTLRRA